MAQKQQQGRQVAHKAEIASLVKGGYVRQEGWQPNYIVSPDGMEISRVNIMATIVSKENSQQIMVDDGTASITVRSFQDEPMIEELEIGDIVNVIGRPREFNNEKYVVPEIIKKVEDSRWVEIWRKELILHKKQLKLESKQKTSFSESHVSDSDTTLPGDEVIEDKQIEEKESPLGKIFTLIKTLDNGEGADLNDVVRQSKLANAEVLVRTLLQEGEVFELKPGRLKVLE